MSESPPDLPNDPELSWPSLLTGSSRQRAQSAVEAIADGCVELAHRASKALQATPESLTRGPEAVRLMAVPSLGTGFGGPALFLAGFEQRRPDRGFGEAAVRLSNAVFDAVLESPPGLSLFDGLPGVAWVGNQVQRLLFGSDDAALAEEVDSVLLRVLDQGPWNGPYDLSRGLVGLGLYALDRLPEPGAARCLGRVLDHLEERAAPQDDGLAWYTPPRRLPDGGEDVGYYDLGVAHGLAGVIGFLATARLHVKAQPAGEPSLDRIDRRTDRLLEGAVRFLLGRRLPPEAPSSFPSVVVPEMEPGSSRAAWCQGDEGMAAALFLAAEAVQREDWRREALDVARRAARREEEGSGVVDAGLCHGAAGLGHLHHRFFRYTGEDLFAEAARRWFDRALSLRREGEGVGGFAAWTRRADGEVHWRQDPGFLLGAAGVGLALLAALGGPEPVWDRVLLLRLGPEQAKL